MGFIVLGIFALNAQGISGAVLQMVNHGIVTPALFLAAAALTARYGTTDIKAMGGLQDKLPRLGALFLILGLASMGLPGLNQFAGEFLIVGGAFAASPWYAAFAVVGVILAAWYTMRLVQTVWHGKSENRLGVSVPDMTVAEYVLFVPLVLLIVLLGVAPIIVTGILDGTVQDWLRNTAQFAGR
jgi:NADH-quinone oxidoreductase subunit M